MKKICVVDRIEDGIAVLVPDDGGEAIELSAKDYPSLSVNDAVVYENGEIRPAAENEHKSKLEENKKRLNGLFNK